MQTAFQEIKDLFKHDMNTTDMSQTWRQKITSKWRSSHHPGQSCSALLNFSAGPNWLHLYVERQILIHQGIYSFYSWEKYHLCQKSLKISHWYRLIKIRHSKNLHSSSCLVCMQDCRELITVHCANDFL